MKASFMCLHRPCCPLLECDGLVSFVQIEKHGPLSCFRYITMSNVTPDDEHLVMAKAQRLLGRLTTFCRETQSGK
jgi:hypothetical protein